MQQEYMTPVASKPAPFNDAYIDLLAKRLAPRLAQESSKARTNLLGMGWILAMLSLIVLGIMTYLFLSMGAAGISAAGIQIGTSWSVEQQLLGIGITSLAVVLVNLVFDLVVFREKR